MSRFGDQLVERVENASIGRFGWCRLPKNVVGWEIGKQIVRSAGSVGANLEEGKGATSRRDFAHRMSISLRESPETLYWIRRIERNKLLPAKRLTDLTKEWNELVAIMTSVLKKLHVPES